VTFVPNLLSFSLVPRYPNRETLSPGLGAQGCVAFPWNSATIPASGRRRISPRPIRALNPNPSSPSSHYWGVEALEYKDSGVTHFGMLRGESIAGAVFASMMILNPF
jgi:hypothetical protein